MESDSDEKAKLNGYYVNIPQEFLEQLPLVAFNGEINVIETEPQACKAAEILKKCSVIGFDTETKPVFKRGVSHKVSLLQLSTNKTAFLFRLNKIGLPDCVAQILADENIIKSGVAINDDIKSLQKLRKFVPAGFVELQKFVNTFGIKDAGLKKLAGNILGFRISKSDRLSNWNNDILTENQKKYAATDAWVGYEIYLKLTS